METVMMYLLSRFAEGAGVSFGIPIIAALIWRTSIRQSLIAATASSLILAILFKGLMLESRIVFTAILALMIVLFGVCVRALRRSRTAEPDARAEPVR